MGIIATALKHLIAAGVTGEDLVRAVEEMEAAIPKAAPAEDKADIERRRKAAARAALYRQRGGGCISTELRQFILERDGYECVDCGSDDHLQIDHIHPVSKGGETTEENLQTLCRPCNARKRDRIRKREIRGHSEEFLDESEDVRHLPSVHTDIDGQVGGTPSPDKSPQTPKINPTPQAQTRTHVREGTRLPVNFELPDDWRAFAVDERNWPEAEVMREFDEFRDYWLGKPGREGRKVDWLATWRNWVRRSRRASGKTAAGEFSFPNQRNGRAQSSDLDVLINQAMAYKDGRH